MYLEKEKICEIFSKFSFLALAILVLEKQLCDADKLQLQKLQVWFCLKQIIGFVHQISTLCLVQFDSCFFDANLAYMLLNKLFPLKLDLQVANELFNCNWCYLTKIVNVEFAFAMWKM